MNILKDLIASIQVFLREMRRRAWKRKQRASIPDPFST